jgi:hypothetical protein
MVPDFLVIKKKNYHVKNAGILNTDSRIILSKYRTKLAILQEGGQRGGLRSS